MSEEVIGRCANCEKLVVRDHENRKFRCTGCGKTSRAKRKPSWIRPDWLRQKRG